MTEEHAEEINHEQQEHVEETPVEQEAPQEQAQVDDREYNFRRLREEKEKLEKEREQDRQMMMSMQQELMKRQESSKQEAPDEFESISPDDWITYDQMKRLSAKEASEAARKAVDEDRKRRSQEELPQRLQAKYNDFNSIVNEANVEKLKSLEPEIARALSQISDQESQAVAAYKYIKALVPQAKDNSEAKARIAKNAETQKSTSSVAGQSPLAQAGSFESGLTSEMKAQLYREMCDASKGY